MNDSWQNPVDEARRFKEANWSPTVLLWAGGALLFAGVFTQQFLAIVAGLLALGAGGYWMQDITASAQNNRQASGRIGESGPRCNRLFGLFRSSQPHRVK
jgi:hypothetical protein